MTPDPAAVRAALANIDEAIDNHTQEGSLGALLGIGDSIVDNSVPVLSAARAWLAQQESPCETESR